MATKTDKILAGCDEAQIAAITSNATPLLVLAGAGSGKTRVLTRRIAWRIATDDAASAHCLALTFTRKAAAELRSRLGDLGLSAPVFAGTFHAVALAQLRQRALDAGARVPVLIESKARVLSGLLEDHRPSARRGRYLDRREIVSLVANEIEWAKARLVTADRYESAARSSSRSVDLDLGLVVEIFTSYEREKKKRGLLDFEDLLIELRDAIDDDPTFAASQRWRFRHLFVDEYQDANHAQIALLQTWLGDRDDLFAVGDPKQAIYSWNGSDPNAIGTFAERFAGASVLSLDANYRSTPQVIAVAESVIAGPTREATSTPRADGPLPTVTAYDSDEAEAIAITEKIRSLHRRGRAWSDCAVLARTNAQLGVIERALTEAHIPSKGAANALLFTRPAVKDAFSRLDRRASPAAFCAWLDDVEVDADLARDRVAEATEEVELGALDVEDLDALVALGRDYLLFDPVPSGDGFRAFARDSMRTDPSAGGGKGVELLTFHRAKGLEWAVVFVTGLEDGFVPIARAKSREALEEEERLLYVALSRAEDELHCSWARERSFPNRKVNREPSPYLEAIESVRKGLNTPPLADSEAAKRAIAESRASLERQKAN